MTPWPCCPARCWPWPPGTAPGPWGGGPGQIAPGYTADLILVDFDRPSLTPCHSVEDNLVYSARGSDVVMNMARGKIIYKDGTFFTLDLERIKAEVETYALPLLFGDGAQPLPTGELTFERTNAEKQHIFRRGRPSWP